MNPLAKARHVLARRPWLYWAAVVALAAGAAVAAGHAAASVDDARRQWGATRDVVVATADLAPGDPLAGHVERRSRPGPMIPSAAVTTVEPTARARQHVSTGEILVRPDVAAIGSPQDMIPAGWAAIAVAEAVPSGAQVGDAVSAASGGVVLAEHGVVVGRSGEAVLVAVPAAQAAQVAAASANGELGLLLQP
jgi:hypothetical protein